MGNVTFLVNRTDGLGSRLRALCNAMALAEIYGGRFALHWPNPPGGSVPFHAIIDRERLFTSDFLTRHRPAGSAPDAARLKLDEPGLEARLLSGDLPDGTEVIVAPRPGSHYLPSCRDAYDAGALGRAFCSIGFAEPFRTAIMDARATPLPTAMTALHLRAGDVVYGPYRLTSAFADEGIPLELAEEVIRDRQAAGQSILLFGQDKALMGYLVDRYHVVPAASLVPDRSYSDTELALFEITLMSRCHEIIAGDNGFASLATTISSVPVSRIGAVIPAGRAFDLILSGMDQERDTRISLLQRAFSLRWMLTEDISALPDDTIFAICDLAMRLDPANPFYPWVKAGRHYALRQRRKAELAMRRVVKTANPDLIATYFQPRHNGKAMMKACVAPILAAADQGQEWAVKARVMATEFT